MTLLKTDQKNIFTPREIVSELSRYIIGQDQAKRAVAIALRNRWRRQHVCEELKDEIAPKNIIMIGPTGVGKTEIARRLANLAQAPFVKVEASKYTEVGYVGRDVESMIRDLMEVSVKMVRDEKKRDVALKAEKLAEERLLDLLVPTPPKSFTERPQNITMDSTLKIYPNKNEKENIIPSHATREKFRCMLREGKLDEREVELTLQDRSRAFPMLQVFSAAGMEEMNMNLQDMFGNMFPKKTKHHKVKVPEALHILIEEETQKQVDNEKVIHEAIQRMEQTGIVFIDELDKVAGRESGKGPDVSREGVQRDLLPIVEGCSVATKYGMVNTKHVLFIAAGAFSGTKPSDLIPELQGRFPIRVELQRLGRDEFVRILTEPRNALVKQYVALMITEDISLEFSPQSLTKVADIAVHVNERAENIGARRLYTIMEKLLDDLSFRAPEMDKCRVQINEEDVVRAVGDIAQDQDLSRYIL